jgi:hypothetical protein
MENTTCAPGVGSVGGREYIKLGLSDAGNVREYSMGSQSCCRDDGISDGLITATEGLRYAMYVVGYVLQELV